jgi:hypothetical protein
MGNRVKKTIWFSVMTLSLASILGLASIAIFIGCQKGNDKVIDNTKQEQVENLAQKFYRADYALIMGRVYDLQTAEGWQLFEIYGGTFWYFDGTSWYYFWPSGLPYWRPPYWWVYNTGNPLPPVSSLTDIGQFVQHTLIDIMNAPIDIRKDIVIENMNEPYNPCVSLSAKIGVVLLEKVVSGEYVISNITETYAYGVDEMEIKVFYNITFSNTEDETAIEENTVEFIFNRIDITATNIVE